MSALTCASRSTSMNRFGVPRCLRSGTAASVLACRPLTASDEPSMPTPRPDRPRTLVAGHRGLVGSALVRRLHARGAAVITATREQLDLRDQAAVNYWFR